MLTYYQKEVSIFNGRGFCYVVNKASDSNEVIFIDELPELLEYMPNNIIGTIHFWFPRWNKWKRMSILKEVIAQMELNFKNNKYNEQVN